MQTPAKLFASVLVASTIVLMTHSVQAITYQVNISFGSGSTLVGTVDVPVGSYSIMNGGATPFTNVMLTLTVNSTPFALDHADTSQIFGTGEFLIDATATALTFDTATSDSSNPADLNFYDSINVNRYVLGSNGDPAFEAAYTTAGDDLDTSISFPFVFGTASGSVPETGSSLCMLGIAALGILLALAKKSFPPLTLKYTSPRTNRRKAQSGNRLKPDEWQVG